MSEKKIFTTPMGTELPLLNLRGKDYLEVKFRVVWFREERPNWSIETELISCNETSACARATIKDERGRIISTSHKFENAKGFPDFIEKAETGSIGRALALIGFGTQFCADELDEGARIVDSPVDRRPKVSPLKSNRVNSSNSEINPSEYVVSFGKFKGLKIKDVDMYDLNNYIEYISDEAIKTGKDIKGQVAEFMTAATLYLNTRDVSEQKAGAQ